MANHLALFVDRRDAGRRLAEALERFRGEDVVVEGLPRGGVPVAYEVATALGAPLDVVLVRKIGAPMQPEFGVGAIGEGGVRVLREEALELAGVDEEQLGALIARESAELERRRRTYRGEREPVSVAGRAVIIVDDGVATGGTAVAAGRVMRARGAERVVLAVPVGPPGTRERFATEFDEVVCLEEPEGFFGVGAFYADFSQTSDEEVIELLRAAWEAPEAASAGNPGNPTVDADSAVAERPIVIEAAPGVRLPGDLRVPESPAGLVLFAHGSGSSRLSPRNREVATALNEGRFATLLFDLLTEREAGDRGKVFDIELLAERLVAATRWAQREPELGELPLGYFGASTGAAAALAAAARLSGEVGALVSRGGRPDLAASYLGSVVSPTLLIVGGADLPVLELNERAALDLRCEVRLAVVPGAGHLFEEPGSLERVSALARTWFARHLRAPEREL